MLGDKTAFLNQYAIPEKMYEEAGMSWADLEAIAEDYQKNGMLTAAMISTR